MVATTSGGVLRKSPPPRSRLTKHTILFVAEVHRRGEVAVVTRQLRLITEEPDEIVVAIRRDRGGELTEGVGDLDVVAEPRQEAGPDLFS